MNAMQRRSVLWTLLGVLLLVGMGGLLYAHFKSIPARIAIPVAAAFAVEGCLYIAVMLEAVRIHLEARFRPPVLALVMTVSALVPYLIYATAIGVVNFASVAVLAACAAVLSFWFVVFPRARTAEFVFVVIVAAVLVSPLFGRIFGQPWPRLQLAILGQLMWTRLAILAALSIAHMEVKGFGLVPNRREWKVGAIHFALFLPVGILLGYLVHFGAFRLRPIPWWQTAALAPALFAGMFLVVALREEFFFRGLLQEWLERALRSGARGLVATSILFGLLAPALRWLPELALRPARDARRHLLRPSLPHRPQRAGCHGDACPGQYRLEAVLLNGHPLKACRGADTLSRGRRPRRPLLRPSLPHRQQRAGCHGDACPGHTAWRLFF